MGVDDYSGSCFTCLPFIDAAHRLLTQCARSYACHLVEGLKLAHLSTPGVVRVRYGYIVAWTESFAELGVAHVEMDISSFEESHRFKVRPKYNRFTSVFSQCSVTEWWGNGFEFWITGLDPTDAWVGWHVSFSFRLQMCDCCLLFKFAPYLGW